MVRMALGGRSFDELLVQLREAHEQELQELRATVQTEALVPSNALSDGRVASVVLSGRGPTSSGVLPANSATPLEPCRGSPTSSGALPANSAAPLERRGSPCSIALSAKSATSLERGRGPTSSRASSPKSAAAPFEQILHQEVDEEPHEPAERSLARELTRAPVATTGGLAVQTQRTTKSTKIFESYHPRAIDCKAWCQKCYPDKQWHELQVHEVANVLRKALKPKHYMINPYHRFVRVWSAIHAVTVAFVGLVTPYEVVFLDSTALGLFLANRLIDLLFVMDIILQFFLQVEIQRPHRGGSFVQRDPWTCRLMYLRSWFLIDLVGIFPFDVLAMTIGERASLMRHAKIVRCLKLLRLARLVRMLRPTRAQTYWRDALGLRLGTLKLIKFTIFLMLFSHWMACTWAFCGVFLGAELCDHAGMPVGSGGGGLGARDATWATTLYTGGKFSPDNPCDHPAVYVAALHWAVMTLTSIGYGDIVPIRFEEYIVCIVCMVAGGLLWAYVIGSICSILSNASPVERDFEMKTDLLNVAMDEAELPLDERDKYRAFLKEKKSYDRRVSYAMMSESFSPMLRAQLMFHISKESITSVYYFNDPSASPSILLDVASCLTPKFFTQLESLDHLRHCLCIIDRGTVAHCGRILLHPAVFHEDFIVSLVRFQKVTRTVSLTYTQLLVLTRADMERMMVAHPMFGRKIRRYAVKTAFIQAVHITLAAYQKWKATMPEGSHLSLSDAFAKALGDKSIAMPGVFRQGHSEQDARLPSKQRLAGGRADSLSFML